MWTKYDYVCSDCDTLFEITTQNELIFEPKCFCDNPQVIRINRYDVTQITETHLDSIGQAHYN